MKAIVYTEYGSPDVLHLQDVPQPTPQENEVLVRVHATNINFGDLIARDFGKVTIRKFWMPWPLWLPAKLAFGYRKPRKQILGNEFSGEIAAIGSAVTRFKIGDPVYGYRGQAMGTYAEYLCMRENGLIALKPANVTFEEAATIPYGALTALTLLRKLNIQPGQKVLINGASGGIGSYAVQFAKLFGAEVTGVCGTPRMASVKSLGADKVIDYTCEDFTQNGETYDLIFDVLGKSSFSRCKNSLNPNGRYALASFSMGQVGQMMWTKLVGGKRVICGLSSENPEALAEITNLISEGKLKTIIDRRFPLEQTADAHRYVESGSKQGHVVITLAS